MGETAEDMLFSSWEDSVILVSKHLFPNLIIRLSSYIHVFTYSHLDEEMNYW
jgi:hypothetical protein